ncbi:MAG: acyl-CoA synthetase [Kiloniellales bacterium]
MVEGQANAYEQDLDKNPANYAPLSPLSFLERAAAIYPERTAVIYGDERYSWGKAYHRARRLASALTDHGVGVGDTVAVMAPNVPALFDAHFGVPMAGAVLNAINTRLDADTIAYILGHGEAKVLITDREYSPIISEALRRLNKRPLVVDIDDAQAPSGELIGEVTYDAFLAGGTAEYAWSAPADEWQAISLNYTSGTTGNPKGVVYHHRGAYLNALGNILIWGLSGHPVYLWTLPMFHCNGWCFPWTITALAGTHVCLRRVEAAAIYQAIARHKVTHFCGAPIIMQMIVGAGPAERTAFEHQVAMLTAAAPPPAAVLAAMAAEGIKVTHVYGLTESYGPAVVCAWQQAWDDLPNDRQAAMNARQGVRYPVLEGLMVGDEKTLEPVPRDGQTMGEIFMRGNIVMKGYLKDPEASQKAFAGGWFHTGDLAVWHPDNYLEIKDRSKDIIISGGENISSIEVESTLYRHPAVAAAAVVARPDEKWGETPCAFVELKPDAGATEREIIEFCRDNMAHFKAPRTVVFGPLPKTSTGKIQKFVLRERARAVSADSGSN